MYHGQCKTTIHIDATFKNKYIDQNINKNTNNLSVMFLEKCIRCSDCVSLVLNKTILSNHEFDVTRDILGEIMIETIIDFGRYGFTGVSIETISLIVYPKQKPKNTLVYNMKHNKIYEPEQAYITDRKFPYFIIYRDEQFDLVADKLEFNVFSVFRDRQITKSITSTEPTPDSFWVIKARNINNEGGGATSVDGYDLHIPVKKAKTLAAYKYVNDTSVYLTPNMTYNPRVMENIKGVIADGSTAVLIPNHPLKLTPEQISYFSTDEYRTFYKIARNLSTQSINVDKSSVFFYGKLKNDTKLIS